MTECKLWTSRSESLVSDRFYRHCFEFCRTGVLLPIGIYGVMTFWSSGNQSWGFACALALQLTRAEVGVGEGLWAALMGMAIGLPGVYLVGKNTEEPLYNVGAMMCER